MKKFFTIIICLLGLCTSSWAGEKPKMLVDGRQWQYEENWWEDGISYPIYKKMEHYVKIDGDTLFQEQQCKRIVDTDETGSRVIGVAYEQDAKVFCYMFNGSAFRQGLAPRVNNWELLYDFGTELGTQSDLRCGNFGPAVYALQQIDSIQVRDCRYMRQVWGIPTAPKNKKEYVVEGIGCESGLFPMLPTDNGRSTIFLACYDADGLIFTTDDFQAPAVASVAAPHSSISTKQMNFDLSGRQMPNNPKGIYIKGGKKVVVGKD